MLWLEGFCHCREDHIVGCLWGGNVILGRCQVLGWGGLLVVIECLWLIGVLLCLRMWWDWLGLGNQILFDRSEGSFVLIGLVRWTFGFYSFHLLLGNNRSIMCILIWDYEVLLFALSIVISIRLLECICWIRISFNWITWFQGCLVQLNLKDPLIIYCLFPYFY